MDLLFNGVEVDCSSQEFGAKAVCTAFEDAPQLASVDDNTFKFSFFAAVTTATPSQHTRLLIN